MEVVVADVIAIIEEGRRKAFSALNTAIIRPFGFIEKYPKHNFS